MSEQCAHVQWQSLVDALCSTFGVQWCNECGAYRIYELIWDEEDDEAKYTCRWEEWHLPARSYR